MPVLALAGAWASRRIAGRGSWRDHLGLWAACLASHALLDWPTPWGTMLFLPATDTRFSLDWIFIVDPVYWVILGALRGSRALLALAGWILFCGAMHQQAARQGGEGTEAFPAPLAPLFWTGVRREGDTVERMWLTPWGAEPAGTFRAAEGPGVDAVRATWAGDRTLWMARAPVLRDAAADLVVLSDLAYSSWLRPESSGFTTTFRLDGDTVTLQRDW
jgi:hypothetical protein